MSVDELRESYLSFFETKGHARLSSASLVPKGDPTLLLTVAGMVPFKPYFLGKAEPTHRRVTTCQRCIRTPDIDRVGKTDRHATFFEMLGNFSFGDYFKREAIAWGWEYVTEHLRFSPERLWVSVYEQDDEAFDIWHREIGVPVSRIVRLGKADNFWEVGVGPCGPCSEIYLDRGESFGCGRPGCTPGCDCDRYLEFWNLVFIQFHQDEQGRYHPLERKSIDTGMGLERTAALLQGVTSIFDTDLVRPIVDAVADLAGVSYRQSAQTDVSLRVITDHARAVAFMAFDGILPSNEGRGYVMRRLLRRAVRHGRQLGISGAFLPQVVDVVLAQMRHHAAGVENERERVLRVVRQEEERFNETLEKGMVILEEIIEQVVAAGGRSLSGQEAFRLYDTFGFPLELTREIAQERGLTVDEAGFEQAMKGQREQARAARGTTGYMGEERPDRYRELSVPPARFVGYGSLQVQATVQAILVDGRSVPQASEGQQCELFLDETPFYPQGGGQVPDTGSIRGSEGHFAVTDVQRPVEGLIVHRGEVTAGVIRVGDVVTASVEAEERRSTARHHTGTHLLHKALREVLGTHVTQAGSLVAPDRLRFDFTHFQAVSDQERAEIEARVNQAILSNWPVEALELSYDEATRQGAMALFEEKYGDRVRMIAIGDYSKELCGGTHVRSTGELGLFKITGEGAVAAGVRRIEAVCGWAAYRYVQRVESALKGIAALFDVPAEAALDQVEKSLAQSRALEKEVGRLKAKLAADRAEQLAARPEQYGGVSVVIAAPEGVDAAALRVLGDQLRDRLGSGVVILATAHEGKVHIFAVATKDAVGKGIHVGQIVREMASITGGGGGGKPDKAEGGGKDASRVHEALARARELLKEQLAVVRG